jgi:putative flippase GtrA
MAKSKGDSELNLREVRPEECGIAGKSQPSQLIKKIQLLLQKFQILNFMLVGGIGYALNMAVYWPLTLVFKNNVTFLGQQFYLPPFLISSLLAIFCNYELNRIWTFKGWKEQKFGGGRYLIMALATLMIDIFFLFILVQFFKLPPVPAAALAILIVFIIRYTIARSWVWSKKSPRI